MGGSRADPEGAHAEIGARASTLIDGRRAPIEWELGICSVDGQVWFFWAGIDSWYHIDKWFENGLKLALDLDAPTQSHGHRAPRLRYERNGERRADPAPSTLVSQARRQGQRSLFFQRRSLKKSLRRHHDCSWSPSARSPQLVGHRVAALAAASLALQRPQVHALPPRSGVVLLLILLHLSE